MKFYIDMDDTLSNFRDHAIACGVPPWSGTWYATDPATWTPEQHAIQARTNAVMEDRQFWATMPRMPGAFEIIAACAVRGESHLLTAYPKTCADKPMVEAVKKDWAEVMIYFPPSRVIVCERHEKIKYATSVTVEPSPGRYGIEHVANVEVRRPNVLIDDATKNCEEWRDAGGIAILHDRDDPYSLMNTLQSITSL